MIPFSILYLYYNSVALDLIFYDGYDKYLIPRAPTNPHKNKDSF